MGATVLLGRVVGLLFGGWLGCLAKLLGDWLDLTGGWVGLAVGLLGLVRGLGGAGILILGADLAFLLDLRLGFNLVNLACSAFSLACC